MNINLIYARARNGVIGNCGQLPWHLSQDLAHFKTLTHGCPVIMGRKTWDSLPARFRPLPNRTNIVITNNATWSETGAYRAKSILDALEICKTHAESLENKPATAWVIGGAQIYATALPLAQKIIVTEIDNNFDGDAYAPTLDPSTWKETKRSTPMQEAGLSFTFVTYERV